MLPLLCALLHVTRLVDLPLLDRLDQIYYDWRLINTMPKTRDERIVIVDIDEKSLATVGRWPWNRKLMAELTRELTDRLQAKVVGFDVIFAESDTSSGYPVLQAISKPGGELDDAKLRERIQQQSKALDYDALFAQALQGKKVVLGYYWTNDRGGYKSGKLPAPVLSVEHITNHYGTLKQGSLLTRWDGFGSNYLPLSNAAALQGHITPFVDQDDGVVRRVPLIVEYQGKGYEALALAVFRLSIGLPAVELVGEPLTFSARDSRSTSGIRLVQTLPDATKASLTIPVDSSARALIPFRGTPNASGNSFRYISASDVLLGKLPTGNFAGKIALVGTTAPGLLDARITPVSKTHPGVEIHAHLLSGMLDNTIPTWPDYEMGYEIVLLLCIALLLVIGLPKLSVLVSAVLTLLVMLGLVIFNWVSYTKAGLVLPLSTSLALVIGTYFAYLAYAYFVESRAKRVIMRLFGTYVPPELVDEMARDLEQYNLAAQSKEMTVMFCDIRGFTRLSETMSPTQLSELVNQVFSAVTEVVHAHRGTLDKYLGDAVMAFWGAPMDAPNHAELAVRAAVAIKPAIDALNEQNRAQQLPQISLGVGVNTGTMFVGDMGSKVRRAYTAVGDAVNLASRLEGLTRAYGVAVICGDETHRQVPSQTWRELDKVRVKGKLSQVTLYEPLSPEQALAETEFNQRYEEFLQAYRLQEWASAEKLLEAFPPKWQALKTLFSERIKHFRVSPPGPHWDGSAGFDSK